MFNRFDLLELLATRIGLDVHTLVEADALIAGVLFVLKSRSNVWRGKQILASSVVFAGGRDKVIASRNIHG